jgi:hypothetical protein
MQFGEAERAAVEAALAVLDAHLVGLNSRDEAAVAATLHFPHYRLAGGRLQTWETGEGYLADFLARAEDGWVRSEWNSREVVAAGPEKVHLDVQFTRYRGDGTALGVYRSLWIVASIDGRWAAQLRSSFAR